MSLDIVIPPPTPKAPAQVEKKEDASEVKPPKKHLILSGGRSKIGNSNMATSKNERTTRSVRNLTAASASSSTISLTLGTKPTFLEKGNMRFYITDAPRQSNLHLYVKEMQKHHVKEVCRFCEPTYRADDFQSAGIGVHDMEYKDGTSPPLEIITSWLELVNRTFFKRVLPVEDAKKPAIAVHCVAGLGRAPVMVAIALIEFGGMDSLDAVAFIRSKRRGAINEKQRLFLEGYKKVLKVNNTTTQTCCVIL